MTSDQLKKQDEEQRKLFKRILTDNVLSNDGKEFVLYLNQLDLENYDAFKEEKESGDFHRGFAMAIESLLKSFKQCHNEPTRTAKPDTA